MNAKTGMQRTLPSSWYHSGHVFNLEREHIFFQVAVSYVDSAWTGLDVNKRHRMKAYTVLNLTTGIERDNWSLTVYANNVTDARGQTTILDAYYSPSGMDYNKNIIRPRSFGVRWSQQFD